MLSEEITRLRNRIITGTYAIGPEGKEPTNWRDYALKLESYIMKLKNEELAVSMRGKHDKQLEKELMEKLSSEGIKDPLVQVERRRGLIKVKCKDGDYNVTRFCVVTLFPEFGIKSFENGFLSFHQIIK